MDSLLAIVIAGFAMFGSPGPAVISIAATGAAFGFRAGLAYLSGIIIGTSCVAVIVLSGIGGLIFVFPAVKPAVIILASLYIVYLAYRIATAPPISINRAKHHAPKFYNGMFLALTNPKAYASIGAVFSGHTLVASHLFGDVFAKVFILFVIIAVTDPIWLVLGSALSKLFASPKASRIINIIMAIALLIAVGVTVPSALL